MNKYYALTTNGRMADVYIFGDITSWDWLESDVSSYTLSKELQGLDVDVINVHINSYGGEVAEGLAIYNMLKNHKAKVETICDGFACSAAAVIFMAGDTRVMNPASLLMIHNVWTSTAGDANKLRKTADDLDIITQATMEAFKERVNISDDELKTLLDNETWLDASHAVEKGFATSIKAKEESENPSQSLRWEIFESIIAYQVPKRKYVDADEVVAKLTEVLAKIGPQQKQTEPQEPDPPAEPQPQPQENKFIKLLNALAKC